MNKIGPKELPFEPGWWSFDLGKYRECDGTYCFFEYDSLPPIDETLLTGTLAWLGPLEEEVAGVMDVHHASDEALGRLKGNVAKLAAQAEQLGLRLPEAFLRLMASRALQDNIPSCTACYFSMSDEILPCPGSEGNYMIRFLNDQQDCVLWYLYLTPQGEECVLASPFLLDEFAGPANASSLTDEWREAIVQHTRVCAPSFEAFIYRFWLENTIWFGVNESDGELSAAAQHYVAHYAQQNAQSAEN
jgi:hypothetical protein